MKRLMEIQSELKAPKNQKNNFGGYKYRSCEDILEAVKPLLKKQGLVLTISDEVCNIGERYYVRAVAQLWDSSKVNNNLIAETTSYAREEESKKGMDASQLTGSTSSYARKYALNGLFAIDDTKDADATNTHGKEEQKDDTKEHIKNIKNCTDRSELELYWDSLADSEKKNLEIVKAFKEMGKKYPKMELVRDENSGEIKEVQS